MCLSVAVSRPNDVLAKGKHLGFEWMVVHNAMGYRCGYVKVEPGHPWYGKTWNHDVINDISVHGGITFNEHDVHCGKGGPDNGYWLGFDCAHGFDLPDPELPGKGYYDDDFTHRLRKNGAEVRSQDYVERECRELCRQASEAMNHL